MKQRKAPMLTDLGRFVLWALAIMVLLMVVGVERCAGQTPTTTQVTGHLQDVSGVPAAGTYVHFQLANCAGARPKIFGFTGIAPQYADFVGDSTGLVLGTIWANDVIDCSGTTGATRYQVTFVVNNVPQGPSVCYNILSTAGTFNLDTAIPATPCLGASTTLPVDAFFHNLTATGIISGYTASFNGQLSAASFALLSGTFTQCATGLFMTGLSPTFMPNCTTPTSGVMSVFGRVGAVTAHVNDYICAQVGGAVCSAFGRAGPTIVATAGDYNCSQITGAICSLPPLAAYNQTIKVSGVAVPQQPNLNFIPGVTGSIYTFNASGGTGYTGSPSVTFTGGSCTVEPTGSVAVAGGAVTSPTITTSGSGCLTPPTPTFSGGGGTGATGYTTLTPPGISCVNNVGGSSTDCTFALTSGSGGTGGACTITDQTSSRSYGGTYQNGTNSIMFLSGAGNTSGSGVGGLEVLEGASSPTLAVFNTSPTATVSGGGVGFFAAILPGYYYSIHNAGAVTGIQTWVEITNCGGGGGGGSSPGVTSINAAGSSPLTGSITIACGTGLSCTQSGSTITISTSSPSTPLTIASFTGGQAGEVGQSFVNPAFSATYTGTPTSANITNTDAVDTPHALTSPYTSATLSGTFMHTTAATTTFTLHATDGTNSPTATQTITWQPAIFAGMGMNVATSTVTASGTTAVLSTGDVLARVQLGPETVGQTFGPYMPNNQYFYFLLTGSSHAFVDNDSGFTIPFDSPLAVTFVNAQGVTETKYLYKSSYASGPGVTTTLRLGS